MKYTIKLFAIVFTSLSCTFCTSIWVIGSDDVTVVDSKELPFASENDSDTDTVVGGDSNREFQKLNERIDRGKERDQQFQQEVKEKL